MPSADRRLEGRHILVTRDPARAAALIDELGKLGARTEARSCISFEPPVDERPAASAVAGLGRYDWLVFTSPTGVRCFSVRLAAQGAVGGTRARVAAIGPATASALRAAGLDPAVTVADSHSRGLADALSRNVRPGERVLVVRPERGSEILPELLRSSARAEVEAIAFYKTVASPRAGDVARAIASGSYDAIVLSSPSNLRFIVEAASVEGVDVVRGLAGTRRVAIGPTTAAAMAEAGAPPHAVAATPDVRGIVAALLDAWSSLDADL